MNDLIPTIVVAYSSVAGEGNTSNGVGKPNVGGSAQFQSPVKLNNYFYSVYCLSEQ